MALTDIDGQRLGDSVADKLGDRNLIINGAMQVAQRATQVTGVTGAGFRTCDRFSLFLGNLGTWTVEQSTDAPDGFSTSFKVLCTTADASPAANDRCNVSYSLEGYDCQRILNTSTTTHPLQLSFWVKSNRTGDASIGLFQPDNSLRLFTASYNIAAANTWQKVTISIPVDTAAAFDNDNGAGLALEWWLNGGSSYEGGTHSAGWVAFDSTARNATNLGVGGAVNDYWQITGVQLEVGNTATPFQHRSYADELQRCDRYCQVYRWPNQYESICFGGAVAGGAQLDCIFPLRNGMRTAPSTSDVVSAVGHFRVNDWRGHDEDANSLTFYSAGTSAVKIGATKPTADMTAGYMGYLNVSTSAGGNAKWTFSAEI